MLTAVIKLLMSQKVLCINNMEHQPSEILEYVFEQLFSINDVQKCAKTCVRWNKIVKNKFKYWGMFLLAIFLILYLY